MPDLGAPVGAMLQLFAPLVGRALRSFLATTVGMVFFTVVCIGVAVAVAAPAGTWGMLGAGVIALVAGGVAGWLVAIKRAMVTALSHGLEKLGLGSRAMTLIFQRLLQVDESLEKGERGHAVARGAERLPLDVAEGRLRGIVESLLGERARKQGVRAWIARKLEAAALVRVEAITLSRFREDAAQHGGVDLVAVRDELAGEVDRIALETLSGVALKFTLIAMFGVSLASIGAAYGLRVWLGDGG